MKTVSFKLPEQLNDALSKVARTRKVSRSAVVREALQAYAKGEQGSVTACVDEATSGVRGPRDLSSNRRHMAGYGK